MKNKSLRILSSLVPSIANIIWIMTFILVILSGNTMMNQDGDLGLHLTLGNYILDYKSIPVSDVFSNSMTGEAVTQHEWLSAVIFALSYRIFGFAGVILVCAVLIATTIELTFKELKSQGSLLLTSLFVILLTIITTKIHWLSRPHLFTFLFFIVWLTFLRKMLQGHIKSWWMLPLIMLFWANLHGGFLMGFVSWFVFALGTIWDSLINKKTPIKNVAPLHFWRFYILGGVSAFAVTLVNPSGLGLWRTVFNFLGNSYLTDLVNEYLSPNFHDPSFWPALFFIGLLLFGLASQKKEIKSGELFHAIVWLVFGLYSARNLPLFALSSSPLVALGLDDLIIKTRRNKKPISETPNRDPLFSKPKQPLTEMIWPAVVLLMTMIFFRSNSWQNIGKDKYTFNPESFPVEAVNWLQENPQEGKMLNTYGWGGYLLYRLWPETQVFIDSKTDFYGEDFIREYVELVSLDENWQNIIEKYELTWAILPVHTQTAVALESNLGWIPIYKDATAVILAEK